MKTLFVLDSSVIGPDYVVRAANEMGLKVVFLTNLSKQEGDALCELTAHTFINCNTESFEELYRIICSFPKEEVAGVISFLDSKLGISSALSDSLGIHGIDPAVKLLKDKAYVDSIIPEFTPNSISFTTDNIPYEEIKNLMVQSKSGLILKPAYAAGARGVCVLQEDRDVEGIESLFDSTIPSYLHPDQYVIQEIVEGELVSLEGYVVAGQVTPIGVTGRRKIGQSESVFIFPYDPAIPLDVLTEMIQTLVTRSGYQFGFFHTEFIVSPKEAKLIDCNFGRPGGANITEVIACAYGLEPHTIYRQSIELILNMREVISTDFWSVRGKDVLGISYGIPSKDRVLEIQYGEEMRSKHTRAQNFGDIVSEMGGSNWSWFGMLSGLREDVLHDIAEIKLRTLQGGWVTPVFYDIRAEETVSHEQN